MSLNYFAKSSSSNSQRYSAVNCVRVWMMGKGHLPKDLKAALAYLIPELHTESAGEFDE